MSSTETATKVIVRHRKNCRSTLRPFPKIIDGITEDSTKIHAKVCTKTIVLMREIMNSSAEGEKILRK